MEVEGSEIQILYEVNGSLENTNGSKSDGQLGLPNFNQTCKDENVVIPSEVSPGTSASDDMDVDSMVEQERNEAQVTVEKDSSTVIPVDTENSAAAENPPKKLKIDDQTHQEVKIDDETPTKASFSVKQISETLPVRAEENKFTIAKDEKTPETVEKNGETEVERRSAKPRQETDFVSEDTCENSDNFHAKWNELKSLTMDDDKYSFVRKRWGNSAVPDPSVDLTYRHRVLPVVSRGRSRSSRKKRKNEQRSLSCVSHMEKMISDVKANYYSEMRTLCQRHSLIMSDMQRQHQLEFVVLAQDSLQNIYGNGEFAEMLLLKQRQDEILAVDRYQREMEELVKITSTNLARYEKNSEEILLFHKQYQIDGSGSLNTEQFLHLQETERMYKEYEKFYS